MSTCKSYETPIGDLPLDLGTIDELRKTGHFSRDMSISTDEDEHSIEMHLPYVRKIFQGCVWCGILCVWTDEPHDSSNS